VSQFEVFRLEQRGEVAVVWLNRPEKLNAMAPVFFRELPLVLEAAASSGAGALVLTGAGRAFSAGGDIESFVALSDLARCRRHLRSVYDAFWSVERAELPVVGAVNVIAFGGGTELALACDIVLASDRARFAFKEATVGLMPGYGIVRGPEVIGRAWTRWLSFTGDEIDAEQALAIGLAQRVVPHDRLLDEAVALAERIAANPPFAVRAAKSFINADTHGRALADSIEATALLFSTDEHKARVAAFLKR